MLLGIKQILFAGLGIAGISMLYFLALVVGLSLWVIVPLLLLFLLLLGRWLRDYETNTLIEERSPWLAILFLAGGLIVTGYKLCGFAEKYGGWDAWAMWNYHARFLANGDAWSLFLKGPIFDHPDYPLLLPAWNALLIRLAQGNAYTLFPLASSVFFTLATITLLYAALARKSLIVAVMVLYLVVTDAYFLQTGVSQYADTPLAFFFLCAVICVELGRENQAYLTIAAACLGACVWTKNEGVLLAGVLFLFNAKSFIGNKQYKYTFAAIALPLLAWLVFKIGYAPPNDLISKANEKTTLQVFDTTRYSLIYQYFLQNLHDRFHYMRILFFVYVLWCAVIRKFPTHNFMAVMVCLMCYLLFYIFTVNDLEWHLRTSLDRLLHQLMPAAMYLMAISFTRFQAVPISSIRSKLHF